MKEFKEVFEEARKEKGLTNEFIAKQIGITKQGLSVLKKRGNPHYKTIQKLAEVLNVEPSAFF
jgi:transcriptional regulator with XRE-family HTH domain